MTIGIDFGTSLTKVAWSSETGIQYRSTADSTLADIYEESLKDGVRTARVLGSRVEQHPSFKGFRQSADPIKEEIELQAKGARFLAEVDGGCLVVAIGTGVSYTRVMFGKAVRMPIGNSLGGGYLDGMRHILGMGPDVSWEDFDRAALEEPTPDLLVGDLYPEHPSKNLVLANFAKLGSL